MNQIELFFLYVNNLDEIYLWGKKKKKRKRNVLSLRNEGQLSVMAAQKRAKTAFFYRKSGEINPLFEFLNSSWSIWNAKLTPCKWEVCSPTYPVKKCVVSKEILAFFIRIGYGMDGFSDALLTHLVWFVFLFSLSFHLRATRTWKSLSYAWLERLLRRLKRRWFGFINWVDNVS